MSDGIYPTPNREGIKYTYETKQIILLKLKEICEYIVNSYNNEVEEINDIRKWFDYHRSITKYFSIKDKESIFISVGNYIIKNKDTRKISISDTNPFIFCKDEYELDIVNMI